MKCAVGKCKQSNSKKPTCGRSVSFYNFPKNETQRNLWIKFCNRVNTINTQREKICALHFKQEDFERNLKFEMGLSNRSTLKLKAGVVPTIETGDIANEEETSTPSARNTPTLPVNNKNNELPKAEIKIEDEEDPQEFIKLESYEMITCGEFNISMLADQNINNQQEKLVIKMEDAESPQQNEMITCGEFNIPMLADQNVNNQQEKLVIKVEDAECPQQIIKLGSYEVFTCDELNTPMLADMNENNSQLEHEVKLENEEIPQQKVKLKMYETPTCNNIRTQISTDFNENSLLLRIKTLENKIGALRQENNKIRCRTAFKLKNLSRQVQILSSKNESLERALKRLFTAGQIKKLKNCDKRQIFSEEDIAESITLYTTSPKAYMLLKNKHFPLPSVRTLQRCLQRVNMSTDNCDASVAKSNIGCHQQNV